MLTTHKIHYKDSRGMKGLKANSVHLVVTSPPYPMISMWDDVFAGMNKQIGRHIRNEDGVLAFELMHVELRKTWEMIFKVLIPGGYACINIGDATRTIGGQFGLYPNHSRVIEQFCDIGFTVLPKIIWRKPTNSPTKFLGSGMLPCGAYVTLEHEYILIFRKPHRREFKNADEINNRRRSSFFWEERNKWFSDMWDLNGIRQDLNSKKIRKRSGAYPIEIPYRLINMYSSKLDTVLDPFLGTATTTLAAIICGRNSVGYELDRGFRPFHSNEIQSKDFIEMANRIVKKRIDDHHKYTVDYKRKKGNMKYKSSQYHFPVVTRQEVDIRFEKIDSIVFTPNKNNYKTAYSSYNVKSTVKQRKGEFDENRNQVRI